MVISEGDLIYIIYLAHIPKKSGMFIENHRELVITSFSITGCPPKHWEPGKVVIPVTSMETWALCFVPGTVRNASQRAQCLRS